MQSVSSVNYSGLSDAELVGLMFAGDDQLPAEFAAEAVSRGKRIIPALAEIIRSEKNWEREDSGWCAVNHAVFLAAAIGGEEAVGPLLDALYKSSEFDDDWVFEELPAIFGSVGPRAVSGLKKAALDRNADCCLRERTLGGLAAIAVRNPELSRELFSFIASVASDEDENSEVRAWAADILLDCCPAEYESVAMSLLESGLARGYYDESDVRRCVARGPDLYWYKHDWLEFYSPKELAARRKRWESERLSEAKAREDAEKTVESRRIRKALEPYSGLIAEVRRELRADSENLSAGRLKKRFSLFMRLSEALRKLDAEKEPGLPPAFEMFDSAAGRSELIEQLVPLPLELADVGMSREGADLAQAWAAFGEAENFLGDRAVILAESGRGAEARLQIAENLGRFQKAAWIWIKAGDAFRALKDFPSAETHCRRGLELCEGWDWDAAAERLVSVLDAAGKTEEARQLEAERRELEVRRERGFSDTYVRPEPKVGRNDPCPCGSGKKYKKCCLGKSGG